MKGLQTTYQERYDSLLCPVAAALEEHIREQLAGTERIDRISARAKSVNRFLGKAEKTIDGKPKYDDPIEQIQDQIGARIVTFYLDDVEHVSELVGKYFRAIEDQYITPESEKEFDYVGKHFVLFLPTDVIPDGREEDVPKVFELQIKTLFQHAWSEANHDLGYKPGGDLATIQKRKIAFTSAQAWGADTIFNELQKETAV